MYCVNLITTSSIYIANDVYFLGGHFNLIVYRQYLKHNIGRSANKLKYLYSNQSKNSTKLQNTNNCGLDEMAQACLQPSVL